MTLAIGRSPGKRHRDAKKAPCGAGEQQTNRTQREWCPVLTVPPGAATAPQASRNTYLTELHHGSKERNALRRFLAALRKGIERRTRCAT